MAVGGRTVLPWHAAASHADVVAAKVTATAKGITTRLRDGTRSGAPVPPPPPAACSAIGAFLAAAMEADRGTFDQGGSLPARIDYGALRELFAPAAATTLTDWGVPPSTKGGAGQRRSRGAFPPAPALPTSGSRDRRKSPMRGERDALETARAAPAAASPSTRARRIVQATSPPSPGSRRVATSFSRGQSCAPAETQAPAAVRASRARSDTGENVGAVKCAPRTTARRTLPNSQQQRKAVSMHGAIETSPRARRGRGSSVIALLRAATMPSNAAEGNISNDGAADLGNATGIELTIDDSSPSSHEPHPLSKRLHKALRHGSGHGPGPGVHGGDPVDEDVPGGIPFDSRIDHYLAESPSNPVARQDFDSAYVASDHSEAVADFASPPLLSRISTAVTGIVSRLAGVTGMIPSSVAADCSAVLATTGGTRSVDVGAQRQRSSPRRSYVNASLTKRARRH